jgi:Ni,Fe-hydrogenase I small subunit
MVIVKKILSRKFENYGPGLIVLIWLPECTKCTKSLEDAKDPQFGRTFRQDILETL